MACSCLWLRGATFSRPRHATGLPFLSPLLLPSHRVVQARGYKLCAMKLLRASPELITQHYEHIKDKPFFPSVWGSSGREGKRGGGGLSSASARLAMRSASCTFGSRTRSCDVLPAFRGFTCDFCMYW